MPLDGRSAFSHTCGHVYAVRSPGGLRRAERRTLLIEGVRRALRKKAKAQEDRDA